jgi:hypothetical protein
MEAVIAALYALLQVIDNLGQFGQIVGAIGPDSNQETQLEAQLAAVESTLETADQEIQQYCAQILTALTTLSQEVFENQMADELSFADQAGIALAEWEKNGSSDAQAQALNTSSAGISGVVEEYNNNAYPGPSMMIVLARVTLQRMAVLSIFPSFRATADNQQVQAALGFLTASVDAVQTYVQAMNQVHVNSQYHSVQLGLHTFYDFWTVTVSYANIQGNETYNKSVSGTTLQAAMNAAQPLIAQADQDQQAGLASDLAHFGVTGLLAVVQQITQWLAG